MRKQRTFDPSSRRDRQGLRVLATSLVLLAGTLHGQRGSPRSPIPEPRVVEAVRNASGEHPFAIFRACARDEINGWASPWTPRELGEAIHAAALSGLWSGEPDVRLGALRYLASGTMTLADLHRFELVAAPVVSTDPRGDERIDFQFYRDCTTRGAISALLSRDGPDPGSPFRYSWLDQLHVVLRPEHVPELGRMLLADSAHLRRQALTNLGTVAAYTDRHRDRIATALLSWPGPPDPADLRNDVRAPIERRRIDLPVPGGGLPPRLHAVLERIYLDRDGASIGDAFGYVPWVRRWLIQSIPGPADTSLLRRLAHAPHPTAILTAAIGLTRSSDPRALDAVAELTPRDDTTRSLIAASLAPHREDVRVELLRLARTRPTFLAAALVAVPDHAVNAWVDEFTADDPSIHRRATTRMVSAFDDLAVGPLILAPATREGLAAAIRERVEQLDARRLAPLLNELPELRTHQVAARCRATLVAEDRTDDELMAFLEVCEPSHLPTPRAIPCGPGHWLPFRSHRALRHPEFAPAWIADLWAQRDRPGDDHQQAIGRLALLGDPDAIETLRTTMRLGLYGWPDDSPGEVLTLGQDLATVDDWVRELETNCCRRARAAAVIEDLIGVDATELGDNASWTPRDWVSAYLTRHRDALRWSDRLGRYVVGPRD